jgi:hypothetical protein
MRDREREHQALQRLRALLAADPEAALVCAVVRPLGPEGKPWVQTVLVDADGGVLRAVAAEMRAQEAQLLQAAEATPVRARPWWDRD